MPLFPCLLSGLTTVVDARGDPCEDEMTPLSQWHLVSMHK